MCQVNSIYFIIRTSSTEYPPKASFALHMEIVTLNIKYNMKKFLHVKNITDTVTKSQDNNIIAAHLG